MSHRVKKRRKRWTREAGAKRRFSPLGLFLRRLSSLRQDGAAALRRRRGSVVGRGGGAEILLGLGQGGALQGHVIVGCGLQDVTATQDSDPKRKLDLS